MQAKSAISSSHGGTDRTRSLKSAGVTFSDKSNVKDVKDRKGGCDASREGDKENTDDNTKDTNNVQHMNDSPMNREVDQSMPLNNALVRLHTPGFSKSKFDHLPGITVTKESGVVSLST